MKQTAVEWLMQQLPTIDKYDPYYQNLFSQAKQIEKEQIVEAHFTSSGCNSFDMPTDRINNAYKAAQQYYNETFKSE